MQAEQTGYRSRMQVAWSNLQAARGIRPSDFINGYRMVHPLRSLATDHHAFGMPHLLMEMFTRLQIRYRPLAATGRVPERGRTADIALFVDAPDHLSGVSKTLNEWRGMAAKAGDDLILHTCSSNVQEDGMVNFPKMGALSLAVYQGLELSIPRFDDVMSYVHQLSASAVHVSTPGPMGLLGLFAARQRGLPVCGTYHTDFPRYIREFTGDERLEETAWQFMRWFYGQLDRVAAPSESVRQDLIRHGFESRRIRVVGRGVDTGKFNPGKRDSSWRATVAPGKSLKLLYVGRLSREKNLAVLAKAFVRLTSTRPDVSLIMVGDGPYREELERMLHGSPAVFTGALSGGDLSKVYASSDLFVFPSRTDTFGRVVLEAQASGLPVVVSDEGGPKHAMLDGETGVVVRNIDEHRLAIAIDTLTDQPALMNRYRQAAVRHAGAHSLEQSYAAFSMLHRFAGGSDPDTDRRK